jgi:hypothetical protein
MGWKTWGSNPTRGKRFFFSPKPTDYLWGSASILLNGQWSRLPEAKQPGNEVNHSPMSSAQVMNGWSYASFPACFHGMNRDFTLTFLLLAVLDKV